MRAADAEAGLTSTPRANSGQSLRRSRGLFFGGSRLGRTKEMRMLLHYFVDDPEPIEVDEHGAPHAHELDPDSMELPSTKMFYGTAKADATRQQEATIGDFFTELPSWPLMEFSAFMALCRKATRVCQSSSRDAAVANCAALAELLDIALRVHRLYSTMGTLGPDEVR